MTQFLKDYAEATEVIVERTANVLAQYIIDRVEERFNDLEEQRRAKGSQEDEQTWYTAQQAAEKIGVSKNTLWRWEKLGYLVPTRVGRSTRYRAVDVLNLLKGNNSTTDNKNAVSDEPTAKFGRV